VLVIVTAPVLPEMEIPEPATIEVTPVLESVNVPEAPMNPSPAPVIPKVIAPTLLLNVVTPPP
jgi:hypothetical protein